MLKYIFTSKHKRILNRLIGDSEKFTFDNNSQNSNGTFYSKASPELLEWISNVENFVRRFYPSESGQIKSFERVDKNKFTGYEEWEFEKELNHLKAMVKSCESFPPYNHVQEPVNLKSLFNSKLFYICISSIGGLMFKAGQYIGRISFDSEKNELYKRNEHLIKENDSLQKQLLINKVNYEEVEKPYKNTDSAELK